MKRIHGRAGDINPGSQAPRTVLVTSKIKNVGEMLAVVWMWSKNSWVGGLVLSVGRWEVGDL